jgi:DNA-binding response OmpR family regulator
VLLVIDHAVLTETVKLALRDSLYATRVARTVEDAIVVLAEWKPHLAILDVDLSGSTMLQRARAAILLHGAPPVIALTRRSDVQTRLAAFEQGVDDILTVPFSAEEFAARILAVMRRTYRGAVEFTPILRLGDLEIDLLNRRVRAGGIELHLTGLEQGLLYLLAANSGRLLTRDEILNCLWGTDYVAESNVVDRHIRNLRVKLQSHVRRPPYIATVPGQGYRFVTTGVDEPAPQTPVSSD